MAHSLFELVFDIQFSPPTKYIIFIFNILMSLRNSMNKAFIACVEYLKRIKELHY